MDLELKKKIVAAFFGLVLLILIGLTVYTWKLRIQSVFQKRSASNADSMNQQ